MKKKFLFGLSIVGISCLTLGMALTTGTTRLNASLNNSKEATLIDSSTTDTFVSGIDESVYTTVGDTTNAYLSVNKPSHATMTNFNYNDGLIRTKESITVPSGKSLVVQYTMLNWDATSGFFCIGKGAEGFGGLWGDMFYSNYTENKLNVITGAGGYQLPGEVGPTVWGTINSALNNGMYRHVFNPDGSALFSSSVDNNEETLTPFFRYDAGAFVHTGSGQVGFMGNSLVGSISFTNVSIGVADDANGTNVEWIIRNDMFDDNTQFVFDQKGSGAEASFGATNYVQANNPVDGAGLVFGDRIVASEAKANKLFEYDFSITPTEVQAGKALGISLGIDENATNTKGKAFAGIRADEDGFSLILADNTGSVVASEKIGDLSLLETKMNLKVTATIVEGGVEVKATCGSVTVTHTYDSIDGKQAISTLGITETGKFVAFINMLTSTSFRTVNHSGKNLTNDFSEDNTLDYNKLVGTHVDSNAKVEVVDGTLKFTKACDGTYWGPKYAYTNFDLKFDIKFFYDEEEEIINSAWAGIAFGKKDTWFVNNDFALNKLVYLQNGVADNIGLAGTRGWYPSKDGNANYYNVMHPANAQYWYTVELKAIDGHVDFILSRKGDEEGVKLYSIDNVDTEGYIAICSTTNGNYQIDNFSIADLDKPVNELPTDTTETKSYEVNENSISGKVSGTSAYGTEITYSLKEDKTGEAGKLVFNNDGSWTFTKKEQLEEDKDVSFTYLIHDGSDVVEGTITLKCSKNYTPTPDPEPDPEPEPEPTPEKKGCGGSIIATSAIISTLALAGGAIALASKKRKK